MGAARWETHGPVRQAEEMGPVGPGAMRREEHRPVRRPEGPCGCGGCMAGQDTMAPHEPREKLSES